mgnify:CR=1 FL=1
MGNGCVPINNLMEDAATAEICRSQLWQWLKFAVNLNDGRKFDKNLFTQLTDEELNKIKSTMSNNAFALKELENASHLFREMITRDSFDEFLTLPAYPMLVNN